MQSQGPVGQAWLQARPMALIVTGLLIIALIVGALVVGALLNGRPSLPAPFGVAGNGSLAVAVDGKIVLFDADGTGRRELDLPFANLHGVSFSRDGTRFAAWAEQGERQSLIVANVDGSNATEIDASVRGGDIGALAWSPDDERLAFSANRNTLYIVSIADGRTVAVGSGEDPVWSPDGRLAYACGTDVARRLCIMHGDGTGERILSTLGGTIHAFQGSSWSHDGRTLAYQIDDVDGTGGWDIAVTDVDQPRERILTRRTKLDTIFPVWSPDGQYVLFVAGHAAGRVRPDGSDLRFFNPSGACASVAPSPDAGFLACLSGDRVVLWPISGGEAREIRLGGTTSDGLSWQRLRD